MGWNTGSYLFNNIIEALLDSGIDEDARESVYRALIPQFEDMDCDTMDECVGNDKIFDKVYKELNPEYFNDYEENWIDEEENSGC